MNKSFIKAISYYLPEIVVTNEDLAKQFPEWTAEKISQKIGIDTRRISAQQETSLDMAESAGRRLFQEHNIDPDSIDFILLCTQSPDFFLPTSACILQNKLGISNNAGALDFNLGCSGYVYGLGLANGLICSGIAENVLLITSETYSKYIHSTDKVNRAIFGDGASASLISKSGFAEIQNFSFGTDGAGAGNLIVKSGGLRNPEKFCDYRINDEGNPVSSDHLFMDGSSIFNFTLEMVPLLVKNTLEKNKINSDEIDQYIFHQANSYMLNFLRKKISIPVDKFFVYMKDVGNTVSSTIPIALYHFIKDANIVKPRKVLLAGFGVGLSWGGVVIKIKE